MAHWYTKYGIKLHKNDFSPLVWGARTTTRGAGMNRQHTHAIAAIAMLAALVFAIGTASANEPAGATVSDEEVRGRLPVPGAGQVTVEAGNITVANLDTNMSTLRWAGVFGNTSGNIILGDSDGNQLYVWTAEGNLVYFANAAVEWTSLQNANEAEVVAEFPYVGGAIADNYTTTFTGATPANIGSNIFTTLESDYAETLSAGGNTWRTYSLRDGTGAFLFAGRVDVGNQAYDGSPADFQVILPDDGTGTSGGTGTPETWDVYVELI